MPGPTRRLLLRSGLGGRRREAVKGVVGEVQAMPAPPALVEYVEVDVVVYTGNRRAAKRPRSIVSAKRVTP